MFIDMKEEEKEEDQEEEEAEEKQEEGQEELKEEEKMILECIQCRRTSMNRTIPEPSSTATVESASTAM